MAGYTKLNLKDDVEDQAPKLGFSPNLEFRMARDPLESQESAVSYQRVAPNFRLPFGHTHARQEEVYVLVGGSAHLKLDEEIVELESWDAVRIAKDRSGTVEAGAEGAEFILIGAPKTSAGDAEMLQDWWPTA